MARGERLRKKDILAAIEREKGIITRVAAALDCSVGCIYDWKRRDPHVAYALAHERNAYETELVDLAEDQLKGKIMDGDTSSIHFALKTLGKKRGYSQTEQVTTLPITAVVRGTMDIVKSEEPEESDESGD